MLVSGVVLFWTGYFHFFSCWIKWHNAFSMGKIAVFGLLLMLS
jgi:hypothetical protein